MNVKRVPAILDDATLRVCLILPTWKDRAVFLVVARSGMCLRKRDGKKTYLFCFAENGRCISEAGKDFCFESREEAEEFILKRQGREVA